MSVYRMQGRCNISYSTMCNPLIFIIIYYILILVELYNGMASSAFELKPSYKRGQLPYARMPLFGDVHSTGYYATELYIGTPPQKFSLIVDTGSTVTFVPCSKECSEHENPGFKPEMSSTYQPVKCNPNCRCDYQGSHCTYEMYYGEGSSTRGVLVEDVISFGKESEVGPQPVIFGCELDEIGNLRKQRADGILGLGRGRGRFTILDQLVGEGVIMNSFSLCYGGMDADGGHMILGGISPIPEMVFADSNPSRSRYYYNIGLKEIHVAGKPLKLNPTIFNTSDGTVVDSGTTYAFLPEQAFIAFKNAILNETDFLKQISGPDPKRYDTCFSGVGRDVIKLSEIFPEVKMVFNNDQKLSLSPENYLFRHPNVSGAYCLGIYQNNMDSTTLLGGIIVRNTLVTYDRENNRIGFWKTECSQLWNRLDVGRSFSSGDASEGIPSAQAPAPFELTKGEQGKLPDSFPIVADQAMHDEL